MGNDELSLHQAAVSYQVQLYTVRVVVNNMNTIQVQQYRRVFERCFFPSNVYAVVRNMALTKCSNQGAFTAHRFLTT